jgi:hypothetical protein
MRASDAQEPSRRRGFVRPNQMEAIMIGKLVRGLVGEKLAPRGDRAEGAALGVAAPWLLRRAVTPVGIAILGAWGAKKLWDRRRARAGA